MQSLHRCVIAISDGEFIDDEATHAVTPMSVQIKASGVDIITIGVGQWTKQTELRRLASRPEDRNTLHVANYDTLFQAADLILSAVCNGIILFPVFSTSLT